MDTAQLERAEAILRDAARENTKLSFAHRKAAQRLHRAADEMRAVLGPLGIKVIEVGTDDKESKP